MDDEIIDITSKITLKPNTIAMEGTLFGAVHDDGKVGGQFVWMVRHAKACGDKSCGPAAWLIHCSKAAPRSCLRSARIPGGNPPRARFP